MERYLTDGSRIVKPCAFYDILGFVKSACQECPSLRYSSTNDMHYCWKTGEILFNWKNQRGESCPLIPILENEHLKIIKDSQKESEEVGK